jgi:hypothetical protein
MHNAAASAASELRRARRALSRYNVSGYRLREDKVPDEV